MFPYITSCWKTFLLNLHRVQWSAVTQQQTIKAISSRLNLLELCDAADR